MPRGIYPRRTGTSYNAKHIRVRKARGLARNQVCESCPDKAAEWATIKGRDGMNPEDYMPLCRSCHQKYDFKPENIQAATDAKIGRPRPDTAAMNRARAHRKSTEED